MRSTRAQVTALFALLAVSVTGVWYFSRVPPVLDIAPQPQLGEVATIQFTATDPDIETLQTGALESPGVAKPLRLFAVYPSRTVSEGRAVLGTAEASSRTYVVGALLENGTKLIEVFDDRAVLVKDEKRYTLYVVGRQGGDQLSADDTSGLTVGSFLAPQPELDRPAIRATDFLRAVPAYDGERIVGFTTYPGSRNDQFNSWGLEQGDVLVSAGGLPLSAVSQMELLLDQLAEGAVVVAEVRRDGERIRVTLDGPALLATASSLTASPPLESPIR